MSHLTLIELCYVVGALFLASNIWFFVRVLRPIQKLSLQSTQLGQGKLDSFDAPCEGISEIRTLHRAIAGMVGHVRRAQEQSRVYAEQLADGQENERKRIARELHDDAVQSIIAVTQGLDMAKSWVHSDPERAVQSLQLIRTQAVEIVTGLRNLIGDLRPPALEELGLIPALEMQLGTIKEMTTNLTTQGEVRRLNEAQELALFRVAQEALRNVTRHSKAQHVTVHVKYQAQGVSLQVQDDGCGFRPPLYLGDYAFQDHYGLLGIQERVTNLNGRFTLESAVDHGTTLTVYLPTTLQNKPDERVRDPVCSALLEPDKVYSSVSYEGDTYYFCCPVCQGAFQKNPEAYSGS